MRTDGDIFQSAFALESFLKEQRPELVVSWRTVVWDSLVQQSWFQLFYEPAAQFALPYLAGRSGLTVWQPRHFAESQVEPEPVRVHIPGKIDVVGFQKMARSRYSW